MSEEFNLILQSSAQLNLGKNGVTEGIIDHIRALMKGKKFLKIKVLKEAVQEFGLDNIIAELIRELEIYVYDVRGHVIIISKRHFADLHQPKAYFILRAEILAAKKAEKEHFRSPTKKNKSPNLSEASVPSEDFIDYDDESQTKLEVMDLIIDGVEAFPDDEEELDEDIESSEDISVPEISEIIINKTKSLPKNSTKSKKSAKLEPSNRVPYSKKSSRSVKKPHGKMMVHKKTTKKSPSSEFELKVPRIRSHQKLQSKSGRHSLNREGKKDG